MDARGKEDRLLAERAAEWVCRLRSADLEEKTAFLRWLRESPRNVREMLIALTWDEVLRGVDRGNELSMEQPFSNPSNVVRFSE